MSDALPVPSPREKWLFKWTPARETTLATFSSSALRTVSDLLKDVGPGEHIIFLTEVPPPRFSMFPYVRSPLALVSVKGTAEQLSRARDALKQLPGTVEGWKVDEAIPVVRKRTWNVGEKAPGVTLLTLFRRNPLLSQETFLSEWYNRHTPMSLDIHPLTGYVRNRVGSVIIEGSKEWHGIVTECTAEREDLIEYGRMFGGPKNNSRSWMMLPNMIKVGLHIMYFIDMRTIENYFVEEYVLQEDVEVTDKPQAAVAAL
ncbi:hypothetical protein M427DRAFT_52500 [Gonapodya prolifera JEL478]|uniref:EthD domain-containing protein n=1 Tax=Gonapodya prolifera (strain JEL478) TaxID=1344416 RepID=A0A139AU45_GONPJ|nr:hypothetical protein M427DRAFT_52500 [Gonapodya prolifera JEL478]|eukprot:KXS20266.1 hypothetical protein M427DRAFT_52500 [Gonapodya prolifera JEL478]